MNEEQINDANSKKKKTRKERKKIDKPGKIK